MTPQFSRLLLFLMLELKPANKGSLIYIGGISKQFGFKGLYSFQLLCFIFLASKMVTFCVQLYDSE